MNVLKGDRFSFSSGKTDEQFMNKQETHLKFQIHPLEAKFDFMSVN